MAIPENQQAWIYHEYGPVENIKKEEIEVEKPVADQVLVKVHAASVNPTDSKRRTGYVKNDKQRRATDLKAKDAGPPTVPGYDVAGVVVQVGSDVTQFEVGDRVYGTTMEHPLLPKRIGSLAQYTAVPERLLAVIPERLSFIEAASLPVVLLTAYQTLEKVGLKEGQTVLILRGAGGVGSIAVQLARYVFKASVVATTASGPKVDLVKSLGASVVIDYKKEPLSEHPTKYDVVFDTLGINEGAQAMKENGSAITIMGFPQPPEVFYVFTSRGSELTKLNPYFQNGTLKPVLDSKTPYKFDDVVEAYKYLDSGRATGNVVVTLRGVKVEQSFMHETSYFSYL